MSLFTAMNISSSGLSVQRERLEVTSQNVANANSTRTPEGGPYQRHSVVISSVPSPFEENLTAGLNSQNVQEAQVTGVIKDNTPPRMIYDKNHPDANEQGYVAMPDINTMEEMIDVMSASKAYEANITVMDAAKTMVIKTLDLGSV